MTKRAVKIKSVAKHQTIHIDISQNKENLSQPTEQIDNNSLREYFFPSDISLLIE